MKKEIFCSNCGKKFIPVGREHICPDCKAQAAEESKRAAVLRAKRASWTGESVPVRISGRASTLIREYATANSLPFAQALDALLQSTPFFTNIGTEWSTIVPYKSRRRDKSTATSTTETETEQEVTKVAKLAKPVKQATSKATSKPQASKKVASKAAGKAASKASASKK